MSTGRKTTATGTSFGEPGRSAKVTCQFNDKGRRVYELDCDETRLLLTMSAAPEAGDRWEIEASVRDGATPKALHAFGTSRDEALVAVGDEWNQNEGRDGYRRLNWKAIREALVAVRGV